MRIITWGANRCYDVKNKRENPTLGPTHSWSATLFSLVKRSINWPIAVRNDRTKTLLSRQLKSRNLWQIFEMPLNKWDLRGMKLRVYHWHPMTTTSKLLILIRTHQKTGDDWWFWGLAKNLRVEEWGLKGVSIRGLGLGWELPEVFDHSEPHLQS